jgi:hypothetical protein
LDHKHALLPGSTTSRSIADDAASNMPRGCSELLHVAEVAPQIAAPERSSIAML